MRLFSGHAASAAEHDAWLPGSGNVAAAVATGVPFLVMSELTLGITDYAALGVLGGTTPIVSGFGLRPRGAVPLAEHWRALVSAPVVFYPRRVDGPAWWLTRPSASLEWRPTSAWQLAAGGGIVAVATHDALIGDHEDETASSAYGRALHRHRSDLWWTLNGVISRAVSERSWLFADLTLVLRGPRLAGGDWIGGPPFILFLGVSTSL
ncbi:MAG TPA: hypothetical protein VHB79_31820 [Polyangiaceae bacterium]|nr:hypothetical protein [Polyangiaceae bacterium]